MTVNEIEGMAMGRIANPDIVRRMSMRAELNGAYREMVQDVRDADTEVCDQTGFFDLISGRNEYQRPPNADSIRRLERFDLSGLGVSDPVATPCKPVPFQQIDRAYRLGAAAYCIDAPTGLILIPKPALDYVDGARITWLPVAEELIEDEQVPRIPYQLHDHLASRLMRRLLSIAGVRVENREAVADWIVRQQQFLITFLNPSGSEYVTRFSRRMAIYGPRRP